jgi:uncharacterized LabA/DUF88 family protein
MDERPKAIVYVDGLNLYYRLLAKRQGTKWLDLSKLCEVLLPGHRVILIRYFTSKVKAGSTKPDMSIRQDLYLRALATIEPRVSIHFGKMVTRAKWELRHPLTMDENDQPEKVRILRTEEKGSDVALGSYMVLDASKDLADLYVLISSDTDFIPTLELVKTEFATELAVFSPSQNFPAAFLTLKFAISRIIREAAVMDSQFPEFLKDSSGNFSRPSKWS